MELENRPSVEGVNWNSEVVRYILLVGIVLAAIALLIGISFNASGAALPADINVDMNVNGVEYYDNCTSNLNANINVNNGGDLTLDNVTLNIGNNWLILVNTGGSLTIKNSVLQVQVAGQAWIIAALTDGVLIIEDSNITGYNTFYSMSTRMKIKNNFLGPNLAMGGMYGIQLDYPSMVQTYDGPYIVDNTIDDTLYGIYANYDHTTMGNMKFDGNTFRNVFANAIWMDADYVNAGNWSISGNTMNSVSQDGIFIRITYGNLDNWTVNDNWVKLGTQDGIEINADRANFVGGTWEMCGNNMTGASGSYGFNIRVYYADLGDVKMNDNEFLHPSYQSYGVYFYSQYVDMFGDLEFSNNKINSTTHGIYFYDRYANWRNMTFKDNVMNNISNYGFYFNHYRTDYWNTEYTGNEFYDINSYTIYQYYSSSAYGTFRDFTFNENRLNNSGGVRVYCRYCEMEDVTIKNNTFTYGRNYGFYFYPYYDGFQSLTFEDNYFYWMNNEVLYVYARGTTGGTGETLIRNNTVKDVNQHFFYLYGRDGRYGNVTIVDNDLHHRPNTGGGYGIYFYAYYLTVMENATVERNVFQNWRSAALYFNFQSRNIGQARFNNNTIVNTNSQGMYIYANSAGADYLAIQNNTLVSNNGEGIYLYANAATFPALIQNNQIVNCNHGIRIYGNNANMQGGTVDHNKMFKNNQGLYVEYEEGLTYENNTITSSKNNGVYYRGQDGRIMVIEMRNNVIMNNGIDFNMIRGIELRSYNNTFETVTVANPNGDNRPSLLVMGIMDIQVLWEDGSGPAGGADIDLSDNMGRELFNDTVDNQGWVHDLGVILKTVNLEGEFDNNPITINASKNDIRSSMQVTAEYYSMVTMYIDNLAPVVDIFTPEDMSVTNEMIVKVAGQTEVDAWLRINYDTVELEEGGVFEFFVTLEKEGNNDILLMVEDRFNNSAVILLHVTRDTQPPELEVTTPEDDASIADPSLLIEGETEPGVTLKINEHNVPVSDTGMFLFTLLLTEGENEIEVVAMDRAGNVVTIVRNVYLDSVPPSITVITPANGLITSTEEIEIRGFAEGARTLTINSINVRLVGDTFVTLYKISPGTNTLFFEAWDDVGNYGIYELTVTVDKDPPGLEVISPTDNLFTGNEIMVVSGSSELENSVNVNGVTVQLDQTNGLFTYTLLLKEGSNRIVVRATDPLGNKVEIVRNVFLDTTPPLLTISDPADGTVTSDPKVTVEGLVEINIDLTVNGEKTPYQGGQFKKVVELEEGNNRIVVIATDKAGNKAMKIVVIYLDSKADLQIFSPADNYRTTADNITFSGRVEPGSFIKIGTMDVDVDLDGRFSAQFPLDLGNNEFNITVTDNYGNQYYTKRTVILEDDYVPEKRTYSDNGSGASSINWILGVVLGALVGAVMAVLMFAVLSRKRGGTKEPEPDEEEEEAKPKRSEAPAKPASPQPQPYDPTPLAPSKPPQQPEPTPQPQDSTYYQPDPYQQQDAYQQDTYQQDAYQEDAYQQDAYQQDHYSGMTDTAAEGEIGASDSELIMLKRKAEVLEERGLDTAKAKQHLKMANYYKQKNRSEKAERQIDKARQLLKDMDPSGELDPVGGETPMPSEPPTSPEMEYYTRFSREGE